MAAEQHYTPCGVILNMNPLHDDAPLVEDDIDPLAQYLPEASIFGTDLSTEAETNYYLRDAVETLYPSIIFSLARVASDQRHWCDLIKQAMLASAYTERAERIAAEATEGFTHAQAQRADTAWTLILLAAAQKAFPDPDWIEARAMCKRVHAATSGNGGAQ